ncbi:cysteine-rich motor neuron 1 protein-like [Astyanax mexicanus]|uniref:Cysteine-rich motor neuron 1 protein-like n=1 Tax=Astyanax mexicanus TaxID=7994 RepID=A0A8T2MFJ7_ASTMX|nr:cysteine-rich motor neuron 1 protein-like [Astyanax mexicanus]
MLYRKVMLISPVLLLLLQLLLVENCWALSCLPCDPSQCPEVECVGRKVRGTCGCCLMCAKQKGETCGGVYNLEGRCDQGLKCVVETSYQLNSIGVCEEFMAWLKARLERRGGKRGVRSALTKQPTPRGN